MQLKKNGNRFELLQEEKRSKILDLKGKVKEFAVACYDMNSIKDLKSSLKSEADKSDMKEWKISADEWKSAIESALYDLENNL